MKTLNRKKILIGYRYDPSTHSIDRLHQLQAIDDSAQIAYQSVEHLLGKVTSESQLIRTLKNQNLLLKAQIQRIQQKTSFRSYQLLASQNQNLQKQCHQLRIELQQLKEKLFQMENKCKTLKIQKSTKHSSQEIHQIERNDSWKYTFSPYHHLNSQEKLQKSSRSEKELLEKLSEKSSRFPSKKHFIALKTPPEMNQSFVNKIVSQRFLQNEGAKSSSFGQINNEQIAHFNNFRALERQIFNAFSPQEYFQGINSEYMYNDLRTIESQKSHQLSKSQQLQSMVVLDGNFSFMPKPLQKNPPSMKILSDITKKLSFNDEANLLYSSKDFSFSNNSVRESQNISHQSLTASVNEQQLSNKNILNGLSGLRKLPEKPTRVQSKSSDSIRDQQNAQ